MNKLTRLSTLAISAFILLGLGLSIGTNKKETKATTYTESYSLSSSISSPWEGSYLTTYFGVPAGFKNSNSSLTAKSISNFTNALSYGTVTATIGVTCGQNGGTTSVYKVLPVDSTGATINVDETTTFTPVNNSGNIANNTTKSVAFVLPENSTGYKIFVSTYGKAGVVTDTSYSLSFDGPTLDSIAISGTLTNEQVEGNAFDPTGLTVNATWSIGEPTDITSEVTWTPSDELEAGNNTMTASYTFDGVAKTATIDIDVKERALTGISLSGTLSKTKYNEYETFDETGLVVTASFDKGATKDITSLVSWPTTPLTSGTTSVSASYTYKGVTKYVTYDGITVTSSGLNSKSIVLDKTTLGWGSSGSSTVRTTSLSGVDFEDNYGYVYKSTYLTFTKNTSAYLSNSTAFTRSISSIVIVANGTAIETQAKIYAGTSKNPSTTEIAVPTPSSLTYTYDFSGGEYTYFKLAITATTSYVNIVSITINFKDSASSLASYIMEADVSGQCSVRFNIAKERYLALSESEQTLFKTAQEGESDTIKNARQRYLAWSTYLGENPYTTGSSLNANRLVNENSITIITILAITSISATAIGGYLFYKKKKVSK